MSFVCVLWGRPAWDEFMFSAKHEIPFVSVDLYEVARSENDFTWFEVCDLPIKSYFVFWGMFYCMCESIEALLVNICHLCLYICRCKVSGTIWDGGQVGIDNVAYK